MAERFGLKMEEWKIIFAIIGMIVYFLLNARKTGKKLQDEQEERQQNAPDVPPVTFEEMMKQIMERKEQEKRGPVQAEREQPYERQQSRPEVSERRPELRQERKPFEPKPLRQHVPVQEKVKKLEKSEELRRREEKKLKDLEDRKRALERSAYVSDAAAKPVAYQKSKNVERTEYAELFQSPEDARKAFVMGEIFNRKYN